MEPRNARSTRPRSRFFLPRIIGRGFRPKRPISKSRVTPKALRARAIEASRATRSRDPHSVARASTHTPEPDAMFATTSTSAATQRSVLGGRRVAPRAARATPAVPAPGRRRDGRSAVVLVRAEFSVGKLTSVLAKKTQSDLDRVFKGTSKTRDRLSYMDEVLALWRLDDLEDTLDELEETLLSVDFGPATSMRFWTRSASASRRARSRRVRRSRLA